MLALDAIFVRSFFAIRQYHLKASLGPSPLWPRDYLRTIASNTKKMLFFPVVSDQIKTVIIHQRHNYLQLKRLPVSAC
jgi:hypothetical protein